MILILSTPRDTDTQLVIDYLKFKKVNFFRLNDEDIMTGDVSFYLNPKNIQKSCFFRSKEKRIYASDVSVVWMRKFGFFKSYEDTLGKNDDLTRYIYSEFSVIRTVILKLFENKKWLFKRSSMLSKLEVLNLANDVGLNTPDSIITSEKEILHDFFVKNNKLLISKSIGNGKHIDYNGKNYPFFTQLVDSIDVVTNKFSPSLFQKYIEKKYELRSFFLDGSFYTMAIFSQNNKKTKIDFRNYDFENPNRVNRYQLPKSIEAKLLLLMDKLKLNTGSIDIIKALDGKYYFLEVNPSGQFGMTSLPCNYNLHQKVAEFLIKKN